MKPRFVKTMLTAGTLALATNSVAATLPEGYVEIAGIASTEGGQQYIYTDYVPSSSDIKIEAAVSLTKWGTQNIWCSRTATSANTLTIFIWSDGSFFRIDRNTTTSIYANKGPALNTRTTLVADYKNLTFSVDGVASANKMASGTFTPGGQLSFFASQASGTGWYNYGVFSLFGVKIYNADGTLEREYVPAQCTANAGTKSEYGLYETQEGKFFPSIGSNGFSPVMESSLTFTDDAENDALVMTVTGEYVMTDSEAATINATSRGNLIKRGSGFLTGYPIQDFKGNLIIEEGVYRLAHQYDCGADSNGYIRVCDKATLQLLGTGLKRAITEKTVYTTGDGYASMGAICGGSTWDSCSKCRFILEGDSYYYPDAEFNFVNYIDLNGHTLKARQAKTWARWGLSGNTITNSAATPASFVFVGGYMRAEGSNVFRGKATDGTVKLCSDSSAVAKVVLAGNTSTIESKWPLQLGPNISFYAESIDNPDVTTKGVLNAPMTFDGKVTLGSVSTIGTNSLVNLKGTLTGSGVTDINTGWVNYYTTANDYAGDVVVARANTLIDSLRAGIGIMAGATYSAASTVLTNADIKLAIGGDPAEMKGPICFSVDSQSQSRMTGGNISGDRPKLSLVRKEGGGELFLSAAVAITGRLEIAEGKVRVPSREEYNPAYGYPGLMGSVTNVVSWWFSSPSNGPVACVYDTHYPHGTDLTSQWGESFPLGPRTTLARGYVWNRATTNVTWTFKANNNDNVWFWLDDEKVFNAVRPTAALELRLATRTLTPGAHKFCLITSASPTSYGPQYAKWDGSKGSLYDAMPIDFYGRGEDVAANFSPCIDPGDGSLFTIDDTPTEELTDPFWLPTIDTLAAVGGTEFDGGNYNWTVACLEGMPKITNVDTFTVASSWALDDESIVSGKPLTTDGTLVCEGVKLSLKTSWYDLTTDVLNALQEGIVVANAQNFSGTPTLSDELKSVGARLALDSDNNLTLRIPADRYFKAVANGVELGYKVPTVIPKETRLDVYRDGVCIDTQYLGPGHRKYSGTWGYTGSGYYFVRLTTTSEDGTVVSNTFGDALVSGDNMVFVANEATEGDYTSIREAVDSLADGGRVYVNPGRYEEQCWEAGGYTHTNGVELLKPIQIIGLTADPAEVVVTRKSGNEMRIFMLNHAEAALRFMTIQGGFTRINSKDGSGGNVLVQKNGGTVENCIIRDGSTRGSWPAGGGNVALFNGRLRNCVLIGGENSNDNTNLWVLCGGSLLACQHIANTTITIENCLITGCTSSDRSGAAPIGLYGSSKLVNCTVVGNSARQCGGVAVSKFHYDNWTAVGELPQIVNCAFFGNSFRGTQVSDIQLVCFLQTDYQKRDSTCTPEELAACCVNCAAPIALNATCIETTTPGFVDAENGDYSLLEASPLVNAGYDTSAIEGVTTLDLLGANRFVKRVDIGCYERQLPKLRARGMMVLWQ